MAQGYINRQLVLTVNFTPRFAGLDTVGYTLRQPDGTVYAARTELGVTDLGFGNYAVSLTPVESWSGVVDWDTGTTPARHAMEDVTIQPDPVVLDHADNFELLANSLSMMAQVQQMVSEIHTHNEAQAVAAIMGDPRNIRRIPDDPVNPNFIRYTVKHPEDPDWSTPVVDFSIPISYNERGVVQFGGEGTVNFPLGG